MSFWVKTDAPAPVRLWVGVASNNQYPAYMWYYSFVPPAPQDWRRIRIAPVSFEALRFWCPPTESRLWLHDLRLRRVQERVIEVPLELPAEAVDWGIMEWRLSPSDARVEAEQVAAEEDHLGISLKLSWDPDSVIHSLPFPGPLNAYCFSP